ncbi:MBL fold metallo-hydrolase [Citricoccus nitrophenolicus]
MASTAPAPEPQPAQPPVPSPAPQADSHLTTSVLADNPSGMTLEGTNTYLIGDPEAETVVVVDPGPVEGAEQHLEAVLEAAGGRRIELILVTHHHGDHTGAVDLFATQTGAPVRGGSPDWSRGGAPLVPGERIPAAGVVITAWHTPGHTSDSFSFALPDDGAAGSVLTGDTVLGRGTTVIDHPDGTLADYLRSLETLIALGDATVLPAHGPVLPSMAQVGTIYRNHRQQRLDQARQALAGLEEGQRNAASIDELARLLSHTVYPDIDERVRPAAVKSLSAQLAFLENESDEG